MQEEEIGPALILCNASETPPMRDLAFSERIWRRSVRIDGSWKHNRSVYKINEKLINKNVNKKDLINTLLPKFHLVMMFITAK